MKREITILTFILFFTAQIQAQEENVKTVNFPRLRLGIEAGWHFLSGAIDKPVQIRENQSYYYDYDYDYYCGFVSNDKNSNGFYFGIKPEYMFHKRLAVAVGLRFSFNKIRLNSDRDYFLWKISEDEINTNCVKIKDIIQSYYYIGIPVEIRFFPREKDHFVRQYFIGGMAFNFLAASTKEVSFQNSKMEKYTSDVLSQIEKPGKFQYSLYAGVGLKIGKMSHPFGNIEFLFPVIAYGGPYKPSAFGFGIRTILQIPVFHRHQLTYKVK